MTEFSATFRQEGGKLRDGQPRTPFLKYGDRVRIEITGDDGGSIFGAIDQAITPLTD